MLINLNSAIRKVNCLGIIKLIDCIPRYIPNYVISSKCDYTIIETAKLTNNNYDKLSDETIIKNVIESNKPLLEMVNFKFYIKLPLFVQIELMNYKHATINQFSITDQLYLPDIKADSSIDYSKLIDVYKKTLENNINSYECYKNLCDLGISSSVANMFLPQNIYTKIYWSINLRNYLDFIQSLDKTDSSVEINDYANATVSLVKDICPITFTVYKE